MAAEERYAPKDNRASDPANGAFAITPDNSNDLDFFTRGIYVGSGGEIRVAPFRGDAPVTFVGVPSGTVLPVRVTRVYATGTDASDLVGLD